MQQDGSSLSNKLLSLIGSASAVIKKNPRSSFTPVDAFNPSPSFASNSNQDDQPHSNYQLSNEYDKNDGTLRRVANISWLEFEKKKASTLNELFVFYFFFLLAGEHLFGCSALFILS